MNDLNSILIEGTLAEDPVRYEDMNNREFCRFTIAATHLYKRGDQQTIETSTFDVEVWDRLADNCYEYLKSGRAVRVVGRLKQDMWKDAEGQTRSLVKIVAEHVEFRMPARKTA